MSKFSPALSVLVALSLFSTAGASTPTIEVTALDSEASEADAETATFLLTREGGDSQPLVVPITLSGSATPGKDYAKPDTSVTFPANVFVAIVTVKLLPDTLSEGAETLVLSLVEKKGAYLPGAEKKAQVTILDMPRATIIRSTQSPSATKGRKAWRSPPNAGPG